MLGLKDARLENYFRGNTCFSFKTSESPDSAQKVNNSTKYNQGYFDIKSKCLS